MGIEQSSFAEVLPDMCPPPDDIDGEIAIAFRAVVSDPPPANAFISERSKGISLRPGTDECSWASCSLFATTDALTKLKGLKRRFPYVATLKIPAGAGLHRTNRAHIDFWCYAGYNIFSSIQSLTS